MFDLKCEEIEVTAVKLGSKEIRGVIFDVDGTLLDSMEIWEDVGERSLRNIGIEPEEGLGQKLFAMTIDEGVAYVKKKYALDEPEEILKDAMLEEVAHFYEEEAPLKAGARELLSRLKEAKVPMMVATSSDKRLIKAAFERLGILNCFKNIYTCDDVGAGKDQTDIYHACAKELGLEPSEILVFEDAIHGATSAKKAGFVLVGVYDRFSEAGQEILKKIADFYAGDLVTAAAKLDFTDKCAGTKKTALTIAGSDCSGGAGIQADMKTMQANGVYAMSAITALTAQNTLGVTGIFEVTPEFLGQQLDAVFTDIYPDAVKIGMVASGDLVKMIAGKLREYKAENIVVDPVMVSTSGSSLISEEAKEVWKKELFPLATVITPNIPEAEVLSGRKITSADDMEEAAKMLCETYHCAVLLKGGHQINDANDLLYADGKSRWFYGKRIDNPNTHGTGCTLSSAIASNLAKGYRLEEAVERAKTYISGALSAMLDLGAGSGPMDHGFDIGGEFAE